MNAVLARVASLGKAKALSLDEARLEVCGVCGLGVGEGRQDTQDRDKDNGIKKEETETKTMVGIIPTMQPTVELTWSRGGEHGGGVGGNRHTEL